MSAEHPAARVQRGSLLPRACERCGKRSRKHGGLLLRSGRRSWLCVDLDACRNRMVAS